MDDPNKMDQNQISVDEKDFKELKRLYDETPAGGVFKFKGRDVLKEYAGYLIQYLEPQLGDGSK